MIIFLVTEKRIINKLYGILVMRAAGIITEML